MPGPHGCRPLRAASRGAALEDVSSFAKYLGGSSANIAFGTARLGVRSAMLSRVGDDHMGRFLLESLAREGCDVSAVKVDPQRLTALVLLGQLRPALQSERAGLGDLDPVVGEADQTQPGDQVQHQGFRTPWAATR